MKKRMTFIILIPMILISTCYYLFDHGYFYQYNRFTAYKDAKKGNIQLVLWSKLPPGIEKIYFKYGVRTKIIEFTNYNWKGIERYNQSMGKELEKTMDKSDFLKLNAELDSVFKNLPMIL